MSVRGHRNWHTLPAAEILRELHVNPGERGQVLQRPPVPVLELVKWAIRSGWAGSERRVNG